MGFLREMDEKDWLGLALLGTIILTFVLAVTNNGAQISYALGLAMALVAALAGRRHIGRRKP